MNTKQQLRVTSNGTGNVTVGFYPMWPRPLNDNRVRLEKAIFVLVFPLSVSPTTRKV